MTLVDRFRGAVTRMPRRLVVGAVGAALLSGLIGAVGGSATAGAFSRRQEDMLSLMCSHPSSTCSPRPATDARLSIEGRHHQLDLLKRK